MTLLSLLKYLSFFRGRRYTQAHAWRGRIDGHALSDRSLCIPQHSILSFLVFPSNSSLVTLVRCNFDLFWTPFVCLSNRKFLCFKSLHNFLSGISVCFTDWGISSSGRTSQPSSLAFDTLSSTCPFIFYSICFFLQYCLFFLENGLTCSFFWCRQEHLTHLERLQTW